MSRVQRRTTQFTKERIVERRLDDIERALYESGKIIGGTGSPEGVIIARPGTLWQRDDPPTPDEALYVKGSGTGSTGWRRVPTAAP